MLSVGMSPVQWTDKTPPDLLAGGPHLIWEQEAAGSNPAIPSSSEHMSILNEGSRGATRGATWWASWVCFLDMAEPKRRALGEDAIYFDHRGACRDVLKHRACPGRWLWCGLAGL